MKKQSKLIAFLLIFSFLFLPCAYSQNPPQPSGLEKADRDIDKDRALEKRITTKKEKGDEIKEEEKAPLEEGKKVFIKKIELEGVTLVSKDVVGKIVSENEGKELSVGDMQKVCNLITDEYRKKGYITSRAYLPPQTIKDGLLKISVIEGKFGHLEIRDNKYFSTSLLEKKIELKKGKPFDYKSLQDSLRRINEHPDVQAKAVLVPGKEPGTTDIVLEVKDRLPIHVGFEYDNFGSRYIYENRVAWTAEHNNLLGFDDRFYFKYQRAKERYFNFLNFRYILPLTNVTSLGAYYIWDKVRLGHQYKDLNIKGRADLGGIFLSQILIDKYELDLRLNAGFDLKRFRNFQQGIQVSRDDSRVVKGGLDLDLMDKWGRTIANFETDVGIPDFMGSNPSKYEHSSRQGAGGKFLKFVLYLYRLQPLPFSSSLLWKNQLQVSGNTLPSSEQFQIGGISNVRAYPLAEYSGDVGYATSLEWSCPFYPIPKNMRTLKVPFTQVNIYDAARFVLFYDVGTVYNNKKIEGEAKRKCLTGPGFGFRFNVLENLSVRAEFAIPIGQDTVENKENNRFRTYIGVTAKY
ncbi:MAG: ShlB/FhaC/HecB family hemolysin secretion/activation protein [Candidatus Omnitrophica bacterium]|nr:ShlB/FhaC/HecB family hemolysin secretion/activation protein [Candidatus Omnitrophota bacterium]